ncbi:MAG TPA: hypothetical protein DET40_19130 [Lentisphaeria bacterium]|nr:MAG: hypothetical protein A2X45_25235 [Lentisphaerae bacterium GWF2_50_93]HCE45661.1 hypothetical protein [Lentisphaeria bacterium]
MAALPEIFKNRILVLLLLIFFLALGLRAARYGIERNIDKDSVGYIHMAELIAKGKVNEAIAMNPRMPPLYISFMALGEYSGIGAENTGLLVSILAGALLVIPVFLASRKVFGGNIGLVSAFLAATHPFLIRLSCEVLRDSLFLLVIFSALAFAVSAADSPGISRKWYLAGIFAGLATMTRSEGSFFLAAVALWIIMEAVLFMKKDGIPAPVARLRRTVCVLACLMAGFLLTTVPVERMLAGTPSRWSVVDYRISSALSSFTSMSKKEIIEKEDR